MRKIVVWVNISLNPIGGVQRVYGHRNTTSDSSHPLFPHVLPPISAWPTTPDDCQFGPITTHPPAQLGSPFGEMSVRLQYKE